MQVSYQCTLLTRSSQRNAVNVMKQHAVLCEGKTSKVPGELRMTDLRADTPLRWDSGDILLALTTECKLV